MNIKHIIIALATVAAAGGAMAQEATVVDQSVNKTSSVVSRQAVHQEAVTATAQGRILFGEATRLPAPAVTAQAPLTRAEVSAEARERGRLGLAQFGQAMARVS